MNQNRKSFAKRVGSVALATTFILGAPVVTNVTSDSGLKNVFSPSVVEAATAENIVDFGDEKNQYIKVYSERDKITAYEMGVNVVFPNHENNEDIRVTWKIPDEMAVGFNDAELLDIMERYTILGVSFLDENDESVGFSQVDNTVDYVSINSSNQTIEYNLSALMEDHNLRLNDGEGLMAPTASLSIDIAAYNGTISKGSYPVKVAVTEGPADPTNVDGAYEINFDVTEGEEPEPDPEPEDPVDVDKEDLEAGIEEAKGYDSEDYTEESFSTLTSAVEAAEDVVADEDATQDDVDGALAEINEAIEGLDEAEEPETDPEPEVDKEDLETGIEEAKGYDSEDYTDESFSTLTSVVEAAEEVFADEDATQGDVDGALAEIEEAIDGLVEAEEPEPEPEDPVDVDKEDLEAGIEEAKGYDSEDYTDESFAALTSAVEAAEEVFADEDATQDDVDGALAEINEAIEGLVEAEEPEPEPEDPKQDSDESDEDVDNEVVVESDSDNDNTLPDTATSMFNWLLGGFVAILAGVLGLFTRKGKKGIKNSVK